MYGNFQKIKMYGKKLQDLQKLTRRDTMLNNIGGISAMLLYPRFLNIHI